MERPNPQKTEINVGLSIQERMEMLRKKPTEEPKEKPVITTGISVKERLAALQQNSKTSQPDKGSFKPAEPFIPLSQRRATLQESRNDLEEQKKTEAAMLVEKNAASEAETRKNELEKQKNAEAAMLAEKNAASEAEARKKKAEEAKILEAKAKEEDNKRSTEIVFEQEKKNDEETKINEAKTKEADKRESTEISFELEKKPEVIFERNDEAKSGETHVKDIIIDYSYQKKNLEADENTDLNRTVPPVTFEELNKEIPAVEEAIKVTSKEEEKIPEAEDHGYVKPESIKERAQRLGNIPMPGLAHNPKPEQTVFVAPVEKKEESDDLVEDGQFSLAELKKPIRKRAVKKIDLDFD